MCVSQNGIHAWLVALQDLCTADSDYGTYEHDALELVDMDAANVTEVLTATFPQSMVVLAYTKGHKTQPSF